MTALNCFVTQDAVHLFTDGAIYDGTSGAVQGIGTKIIAMPQLNCVFGYSGTYWGGDLVRMCMLESRHATFDDLAADLSMFLQHYASKLRGMRSWPGSFDHVEIVLAGFSETTGRPQAWLLRVDPYQGKPAWSIERITRHQMPLVRIAFEFDQEHPVTCGQALVREQRKLKGFPKGHHVQGFQVYAVGGFLQHTSVTRDGIAFKVLERWPDKIGEPIDPLNLIASES